MDTMKLLLGATIALLLGALVMSWNGMTQGVRNAPADELARLSKDIQELRDAQDRLALEKQLQQLRSAEPLPTAASSSNAEMEAMKAELAAKEAALREIEAEKERAERDAQTYRDEAGMIGQREIEKSDDELRRARLISNALLMARVIDYTENPEYGDFATIEVLMPENVQIGTVLGIRRNTGIIGQLRIAEITAEGAIGNPLPGFGDFKPQAGDELILPPQF